MVDQLKWRICRWWELIYRSFIRVLHFGKTIDFGEGVDPPEDHSGLWETFWPNGKIKYRAQMVNGVEHGECICFWKDGSHAQTGQMRNGSCFGEWKDYTEDGWHYKTTDYIDSENFTNTYFFPDGSVSMRDRWEDGIEVEFEEFDAPEAGGFTVVMPEQDAAPDEEQRDKPAAS